MDSNFIVCARCNVPYRPEDNYGRWDCAVHPREYNSDARTVGPTRWTYSRYHWDCCGRSLDRADRHYESVPPRGCLPADHMPGVGHYRWQGDYPLLARVPIEEASTRYPPRAASIVCTIRDRSDEKRAYIYRYYDGTEHTFMVGELFGVAARHQQQLLVAGEYDDQEPEAAAEELFRPYWVVARVAPRQNDRRVAPAETIVCSGIIH